MNIDGVDVTNEQAIDLVHRLLHADTEAHAIGVLTSFGYWDNPAAWRFLGDDENNFKTVGSQAASPPPALVEKLVNSVDARLMAACIRSGIEPTSIDAPKTIRDATTRFYSGMETAELAQGITLAITGARAHQNGMPCITICDIGEGQTPTSVPDTFMSVDRKNKLRIPFVQGKFNMGGTGALMFCGKRKLQLLITKRDPKLSEKNLDHNNDLWSVTVVRRESPSDGPGSVRNPYFKYLAPMGCEHNPEKGEVLTFMADSFELMPDGNKPYARSMSWGSCIKLYEYDMRGIKGHALRTDGLLSRLEILLPEIALPVRMHECRKGFSGHAGSYDHNLIGLRSRLEESRSDNLEPGYPDSLSLNVQGEPFTGRIYAFKGNTADRYRGNEGIVFTVNGQTHGSIPKNFFERKNVKMGRLAKALLLVIDASEISVEARADLFKNSRDRLSGGDLRREIEEELESQVANHPGLRELRERRRREEVAEKLDEERPLEDVLKSILKSSPSLSKLFLFGQRLNNPFRDLDQSEGDKGKGFGGSKDGVAQFHGEKHPSYFHFEKLKAGEQLHRKFELGRRSRLRFVTDVENDYFDRDDYRGRYYVQVTDGSLKGRELTTSIVLHNGIANWNVAIPQEDANTGDVLNLRFVIEDDVIREPIENFALIELVRATEIESGKATRRLERSAGDTPDNQAPGEGSGKKDKAKQSPPVGLSLPVIHKVRRADWEQRGFDQWSGCTVIEEPSGEYDNSTSMYEFYVNVDNSYLQTDIKHSKQDPSLLEAKYTYGLVLLGLSLIHDSIVRDKEESARNDTVERDEEEPIARRIEEVSRAFSPFILPTIEYLGGLDEEQMLQLAEVGDEE